MANEPTWIPCHATYIDVYHLTITVEWDPVGHTWCWRADWLYGNYYETEPFATADAAQEAAATWYRHMFLWPVFGTTGAT